MKKLALVLVGTVFLAACSTKEQPQEQKKQTAAIPAVLAPVALKNTPKDSPLCTINGQDCWEVVQLLGQTKVINATAEKGQSAEFHRYENAGLKELNLSITSLDKSANNGNDSYALSNGIFISIRRNGDKIEFATVSFPTLEVFVLDNTGKVTQHTPAPSK